MSTVIESKHDTVVVKHLTREEVLRVPGHHGLAKVLRGFVEDIGGDPTEVKSTSFGVRWQDPRDAQVYRATYERAR